jgi:hypothetical protein
VTGALAGAPRISAAVMTHPSRLPRARELRDRHPELGLRIVADTEAGRGHTLATARRAWGTAAPDATHHFVVQDDCLLCEDFAVRMRDAVAARPADALSFFAEWGSRTAGAVRLAALEGAAWAPVLDIYMPTQAVVLPAAAARAFAGSDDDQDQPDDVALARWLAARGVAAYVSVPNLVQHMDLPSLTGNSYQGPRLAVCFGPSEEFAPTSPAAPQPDWLPHISYMRGESGCFSQPRLAETDWRVRPTTDFLADRFGLGDQPSAAFADAMAALTPMASVRDYVGEVALSSIWLTGYALGVLCAERSLMAAKDPAGPLVAAALASLAPGGLRRFLARPLLARLAEPLGGFVTEAVRHGCEAKERP